MMHDVTQDEKYETPENVTADLKQYAAYGVTTVQVLGTDKDFVLEMRNQQREIRPTMARLYSAGQGEVIKGGYGGLGRRDQFRFPPPKKRAGRSTNRRQRAWISSSSGWMTSARPSRSRCLMHVSAAIIDEAHKHHLRAVAHIFYLADAKELVKRRH